MFNGLEWVSKSRVGLDILHQPISYIGIFMPEFGWKENYGDKMSPVNVQDDFMLM